MRGALPGPARPSQVSEAPAAPPSARIAERSSHSGAHLGLEPARCRGARDRSRPAPRGPPPCPAVTPEWRAGRGEEALPRFRRRTCGERPPKREVSYVRDPRRGTGALRGCWARVKPRGGGCAGTGGYAERCPGKGAARGSAAFGRSPAPRCLGWAGGAASPSRSAAGQPSPAGWMLSLGSPGSWQGLCGRRLRESRDGPRRARRGSGRRAPGGARRPRSGPSLPCGALAPALPPHAPLPARSSALPRAAAAPPPPALLLLLLPRAPSPRSPLHKCRSLGSSGAGRREAAARAGPSVALKANAAEARPAVDRALYVQLPARRSIQQVERRRRRC